MSSPFSRLSLGRSGGGNLERLVGGDGEVGVAPGVGKNGGEIFDAGSGRCGRSGAFFLSMEAGGVMKTDETIGGFFRGVSPTERAIAFRARDITPGEGAASSALIHGRESERRGDHTNEAAACTTQIFPPTFKIHGRPLTFKLTHAQITRFDITKYGST